MFSATATSSLVFIIAIIVVTITSSVHRGYCASNNISEPANQRQDFIQFLHNNLSSDETTEMETFVDLVTKAGYNGQEHNITTEDGYILSIHRIQSGPNFPRTVDKPVVLLLHGLFAASDIWVLRGPGKDLAYLLVDNGCDVWALNVRGNYYGKRHVHLSPDDPAFWRFSWHEFGKYDTSKAIDYILSITGARKVSLIGHSMGATMELVLLSTRPEYNDKVNVALAFAPVAIFTHAVPGLFNMMGLTFGKAIERTFKSLGKYEVLPRNSVDLKPVMSFCQLPRMKQVCAALLFDLIGLSSSNALVDTSLMLPFLNHFPQGTSIETVLHFRQIILSGKFRQYDFGKRHNELLYGNDTPPQYPLEKITAPIVLFCAGNDAYVTSKDVAALKERLPNASLRNISFGNFTHLDFILSRDTKRLLYDEVLRIVESHCDVLHDEAYPKLNSIQN